MTYHMPHDEKFITELLNCGYAMLPGRRYALPFHKEITGQTLYLSLTKDRKKGSKDDGIIVHPGYEDFIPSFENIDGVKFKPGNDKYFFIKDYYEFPKRINSSSPEHYGLEFVVDSLQAFKDFLAALDNYPFVPNELLEQANFEGDFSNLSETERSAIRSSRIGQGPWRKELDLRWKNCSLTGCSIRTLLRGSHIRPWRDANNKQRLDPDNGLLLRADVDALFDAGLVTFSDTGKVAVSEIMSLSERGMIPFDIEGSIRGLNDGNKEYLEYHSSKIFRKVE